MAPGVILFKPSKEESTEPGSNALVLFRRWSIDSVQFEVEPASIAHRFTRVVSPPEGRCVCAGVCTLLRGISM